MNNVSILPEYRHFGYGKELSRVVGIDISEKMLEPTPIEETIRRIPKYAKDLDKPNFLLMKARKI